MALNPCSHLICSSCYDDLPEPKVCPTCRTNSTSTTNMLYSVQQEERAAALDGPNQQQLQAQRQSVLQVLPEDNLQEFVNGLRCPQCMKNAVNMALNPCGHLICSSCYDNRLVEPKICPKCSTNITSTTNMFYGGYKQKYLKYKNKYLKLKNYK